jgi:gamma-glutamyltranspeptidase/glutathione hydrolase
MCPGALGGRAPRMPDPAVAERTLTAADTRFGVGEPTFAALPPVTEWAERELFVGDTCHIDVIDRHGNMVAATPSGGWLSSSPTIPSLGFALNTRLQMTWLEPGLPNTLAPGKRPCTTLSPSLAMRDGEPYMVFGTPGGDQQDQWSLAFFMRHAVRHEPAGSHRRARLAYRPLPAVVLAAPDHAEPHHRRIALSRCHDRSAACPWARGSRR